MSKESKEFAKIIIVFTLFIIGIAVLFFVGFNNNPKVEKSAEKGAVTVAELVKCPKHISETPTECFVIDADVNIGITENFNIYTAGAFEYDYDKWKEFFYQDKKVEEIVDPPESGMMGRNAGSEYDSFRVSCGRDAYGIYKKNVYNERRLEFDEFFRDKFFPKKDLDFMSCSQAEELVKNAMEALDIPVSKYNVYPVDYDYIKKDDQKVAELFGKDSRQYVEHTKDDEIYNVFMETTLPNNGKMAATGYDDADNISVNSGLLRASVGKDGLLYLNCSGIYDITYEEENQYIISFEEALNIIKNTYDGVKVNGEYRVFNIELAYVPYLIDIDFSKPVYQLKPSWVFEMYEDNDSFPWPREFVKIIDATNGEMLITNYS